MPPLVKVLLFACGVVPTVIISSAALIEWWRDRRDTRVRDADWRERYGNPYR